MGMYVGNMLHVHMYLCMYVYIDIHVYAPKRE